MTKEQKGRLIVLVVLFYILLPLSASAVDSSVACSKSGYTISTVNGVFTDEEGARNNQRALFLELHSEYKGEKLDYQYLLNPTHLGGLGDVATAIKQKAFEDEAVGGYDLTEMIRSASKKVKTQKLLLVAHSQGNFYANSFYDVVTKEGWDVNKESIGIYSVANPASRVADGGEWITSDTDKVIAWVVGNVPFKKIMPPNTHIELQKGDDFAGHGFSEAYLKYKSTDIVKGIKSSLDKLASDPWRSEDVQCIATPQLTLAHKTTGVVLAVADPLAEVGITTVVVAGKIAILPTVITVKGIYFATVAASQAGTFIADTLLNTSVYVANKAIDTTAIVANEVHDAVTGLLSGGPESGASNMASIIGATTQATPQDEQIPVTIISNDNFVDDTSVSVAASDESNDETLPTSLATQFETQEQSPASDTDTTTDTEMAQFALADTSPDTTQVKSYTSNGGGGGGGGAGSPQPATQDSNTDTESTVTPAEEEAVIEAIIEPLPAPVLSVPQCASSISLPEDNCLLSTTTAHFVWSEIAGAGYYAINSNGAFATTTATSTEVILSDYSDYTFDVSAVSVSGNSGATSTKTISFATTPVAINEIAWMGTVSSASDEWVELKNNTAYTLDLSPWTLYASDGAPYIKLTGTIAPHGTYVLERRDDTVTSISAGQVYGNGGSQWALGNSGEKLFLSYASTTIDQTPAVSGNTWSAGYNSSTIRRTMERISSTASGTEISNWGTNDGIIKNGMDVSGNAIDGTPGEENSVSVVHDADTTAPVIVINGSNPAIIFVGATYTDEGAGATDDVDGEREIVKTDNVNALIVGTYEVVYSASDLFGNTASSTRVVNVIAVEVTPSEVVMPSLFSDLNENSIADEYDSEVIMTKDKTLLSGEYHFHNLTIENNAILSLGGDTSTSTLPIPVFLGVKIIADNLTVANGAKISADEKGYNMGGLNPGRPSESDYLYGANHGGIGPAGIRLAQPYGSALRPIDMGSAGAGHNGGGAIRISVSGLLTNNGIISSNGGLSASGGSVYATTNNLTGAGDFRADGGMSGVVFSGAGGRVAIYYETSSFAGRAESRGGCTRMNGWDEALRCKDNGTSALIDITNNELHAVSIWRFQKNDEAEHFNRIIIEEGAAATMENGFEMNTNELVIRGFLRTAKGSIITVPKVAVNGATWIFSGEETLNVGTLDIINNGTVTVEPERTLSLNINNINIESGSVMSVDERGYGALSGPGVPVDQYMGASYGGKGYGGEMAGSIYGSQSEPTDFGSGGGGSDTHGGGAIRIVSTGTIVIDGNISANGENTSSGGSIYITANNISGQGAVNSDGGGMGGSGYTAWPGGGGRIAVYYKNSAFTGTVEALGGTSMYDGLWHSGENGTVVMEQIVEEPVVQDPGAMPPPPVVVPPLSSEKNIMSFSIILEASTNTGVIDDATHTISITLPAGAPVSALAPVIEVSLHATIDPVSGGTQDFAIPAIYVVTAEDGTTQEYSVTANVLVETLVIPDPSAVVYPPGLPPLQEDVRTYYGSVTAMNGNSITVHINQPKPSDDPTLLDRTVEFTADTKITKRTPGDIAAFQAEMEVFMQKMQSGNTEGAVPPNPPQPTIATVAMSTIVVGDIVIVTALENVRMMKSFSASEIELQ